MTVSLSAARIAALLAPAAPHIAIEVVDQTGSTNADLLARLEHLDGPVLLAAETQTAGRGRAGRAWHSAPSASLTFSLAWPFQRPVQALVGLPLAVGVSLAEVLTAGGAPVALKWPNDVLREGSKLGGILIETAVAKPGSAATVWAVIGIGLNLSVPDAMAQQIGRAVAGLPEYAQTDRNVLLAALVGSLAHSLQQFGQRGFAAFMARWNQLHAHAGQTVDILDGDRVMHQGTAIGVDAMGRLLLDTAAGQVAVMAGDVSLRRQGGA